jgi:hypothetical protein
MITKKDNKESMSELLQDIESLKLKLIKSGSDKGLNDPRTLQISEQLDTYIVKYQRRCPKICPLTKAKPNLQAPLNWMLIRLAMPAVSAESNHRYSL